MSFKLKSMKKISLLIISILLMFSVNIFSQDIKIGYTNVEYILSFLPETKQVQSEVQAYGTQLQNQLHLVVSRPGKIQAWKNQLRIGYFTSVKCQ